MTFVERFTLLAACLATVAASAWGLLALDRHGVVTLAATEPSTIEDSVREASTTIARTDLDIAALRQLDHEASLAGVTGDHALTPDFDATVADAGHEAHLTFVPRHVAALLPPMTDAESSTILSDADASHDEIAFEDWTTETRRDVAAIQRERVSAERGPRISATLSIPGLGQRSASLSAPASNGLPWRKAAPATLAQSYSLSERIAEIAPGARKRLVAKFLAAGVAFPPSEIGLVAIKDTKMVELHARSNGGANPAEWKLVHQYRVLAASGADGPKLRQGDRQVPEGVYGISFLNPTSKYHVALRVNYPNDFDRRMAAKDGRKDLGGDIMIHGKAASIGCLAMGDAAAEELFVLAEMAGIDNVKLVIAPTDFRRYGVPDVAAGKPKWVPELYTEVASAMADFKAPPSVGLLSFFGKW